MALHLGELRKYSVYFNS